ncbi:hypothetical protein V1512DRAFT_148054 [Lipomyces arxii]|uniref:uncharacterized protein n=1 Tax=Lipomyces arxii TaxID=56418 RepID=UPI0034CE25B1
MSVNGLRPVSRRPVPKILEVSEDKVFDSVVRSCFLAYIEQSWNQALFSKDSNGKEIAVPKFELRVSLLTLIRKELRSYPYSTRSAVVTDMFAGFARQMEIRDEKDKLKRPITLHELYCMFMDCVKHTSLVPAQAFELTLAFVSYLEYCNTKAKSGDKIRPQLIKEMKSYYSMPPDPPLCREVAYVFGRDLAVVKKSILNYQGKLTVIDHMDDLKRMISEVNEDKYANKFASAADHIAWKTVEMAELTQLLNLLLTNHSKSMIPTRNSMSLKVEKNVKFVPNDKVAYYNAVVKKCFLRDITETEAIIQSRFEYRHPGTDDRVDVLTKMSQDVLRMIGTNWLIKKSSRESAVLDTARKLYEQNSLSISAMAMVLKIFNSKMLDARTGEPLRSEFWTTEDVKSYAKNINLLFNATIAKIMQNIQCMFDPGESQLEEVVVFIEKYLVSAIWLPSAHSEVEAKLEDFVGATRTVAYQRMMQHIKQNDSADLFEFTLNWKTVIDLMNADLVALGNKYFIPLTVMNVNLSWWDRKLDIKVWAGKILISTGGSFSLEQFGKMQNYLNTGQLSFSVEEIKLVHDFLSKQQSRFRMSLQMPFPFDVESSLFPYLCRTLDKSLSTVSSWVENLTKDEQFVMMEKPKRVQSDGSGGSEGVRHSQSVVSLFTMMLSQIAVVRSLKWNDEGQNAKLYTICMKHIFRALLLYLERLKMKFEDEATVEEEKSGGVFQMFKKANVKPFQFLPKTLVKFNNLEYIKNQLDEIEKSLNSKEMAAAVVVKEKPSKYSFTIQVAEARNIKFPDGVRDTYVRINDITRQAEIGITKVIENDPNPIWNESFTYSIARKVDVSIMLFHESRTWNNQVETFSGGDGEFCLNPAKHFDFVPLETWVDLELQGQGQGQIKIISMMESERDDLIFYFGKVFQEITQLEQVMKESITSKFEPVISHYLTKEAIRELGRVGISNEHAWNDNEKRAAWYNVEEKEIDPLFDEVAVRLRELVETLTKTLSGEITVTIWSSMLLALERLILPPFSLKGSLHGLVSDAELFSVDKLVDYPMTEFMHNKGNGVALEVLKSSEHYKILKLAKEYYSLSISQLEAKYYSTSSHNFKSRQDLGHSRLLTRAKTLVGHRNIKTIRETEKSLQQAKDTDNEEQVLLRILAVKDATALNHILQKRRDKDRIHAAEMEASRRPNNKMFDRVQNRPRYR